MKISKIIFDNHIFFITEDLGEDNIWFTSLPDEILKNIGNLKISCFRYLKMFLEEFAFRCGFKSVIVNEWELWHIAKKFERRLLFTGNIELELHICDQNFYNVKKSNPLHI